MTFGGKFADSRWSTSSTSCRSPSWSTTRDPPEAVSPRTCASASPGLGLRPVLVGAAGEDFGDYRSWLERTASTADSVHLRVQAHRALRVHHRHPMAQFASFYPGAMSEARQIELADRWSTGRRTDVRPRRRRRPRRHEAAHRGSAVSAATRSSPTAPSSSPSPRATSSATSTTRGDPVLQRVRVARHRRRPAGAPGGPLQGRHPGPPRSARDGVRSPPGRHLVRGRGRQGRRGRRADRCRRRLPRRFLAALSWGTSSSGPRRSAASSRRTSWRRRHAGVRLHHRAVRRPGRVPRRRGGPTRSPSTSAEALAPRPLR